MSIEEEKEWEGDIAGYKAHGDWIGLRVIDKNEPGTFEYRITAYDSENPKETRFSIQTYTAEDGTYGRHRPRKETKDELRRRAKKHARQAIEEGKDMSGYQETPLRIEV